MQVFFQEVGPIGITEIQFAVGYLPQQVVGDAQFAACTNEQVWVRHEASGQMLADGVFGNVLGTNASGLQFLEDIFRELFHIVNLRDYLSDGFGYLPSRRVTQRHNHRHGIVPGRMLHGFPEFLLHLVGQPLHVADDAEAYIVLHEDFIFERGKHQSHQGRNLIGRTVPVLRREGIKRKILHTEADTLSRDAAHGLHSSLMAEGTFTSPLRSPASVAIHNNGNVLGNILHVKIDSHISLLFRLRFLYHILTRPHYDKCGILP